ncbi:RNase H domain-containing protein [Trichonephila clavipes]|nr:RNase H domain-containing protein [Trichonephila clavipes]
MNESNYEDICILSHSRNSIQHLKNWAHIGDKISLSILQKVKLIPHHYKVRFQWTPCHVNICRNELADTFEKEELDHIIPYTSELTYLELVSRQKAPSKPSKVMSVQTINPPIYSGRTFIWREPETVYLQSSVREIDYCNNGGNCNSQLFSENHPRN